MTVDLQETILWFTGSQNLDRSPYLTLLGIIFLGQAYYKFQNILRLKPRQRKNHRGCDLKSPHNLTLGKKLIFILTCAVPLMDLLSDSKF